MKNLEYVDLHGDKISLADLDDEERRLVARMRRRAGMGLSWCDFRNYAMHAVGEFYDKRGVNRKKASQSPVFRIAVDLGSRLGIAEGKIRAPDLRGELQQLVRNHFPSQTAFCKATGISADMLSHVLDGRDELSIDTLSKALDRIGYRLGILPTVKAKRTG